jgi:hypothetical protein
MLTESNGRFKQFCSEHPLSFALIITFLLLLFYILAAAAGQIFGSSIVSRNLIEAFGRLVGSLLFVALILRFGWQEQTGMTRLGGPTVWLLTAVVLIYEVVTYVYPYLDGVDWVNVNMADTTAVALNALMTGPLEEFPFRGLILYAFIRFWGDSKAGIWKAVLLSAVFFGASHLVHILFGRPVPRATLIAVIAGLGGIYYAAILLRWRTIWPAVALHSGLNTTATIVAFNTPDYTESVENLMLAIAFQIPLVILGWTIISRTKTEVTVPRPA